MRVPRNEGRQLRGFNSLWLARFDVIALWGSLVAEINDVERYDAVRNSVWMYYTVIALEEVYIVPMTCFRDTLCTLVLSEGIDHVASAVCPLAS